MFYSNTESGLESNNVQEAIDELYTECTKEPTTGEQMLEKVDLEKDPYECRYFFTGQNPNNYITFNNEQAGWRIISVECDGTIKIMKVDSIGNQVWDDSQSNNWARPSSLNTYLNETYYNNLTSKSQSQIVPHEWSIGAITYNNNDLADQVNDENSKKWNGKLALPTISEYLRTNSNINCQTQNFTESNYLTCRNTTWMHNSNINWWWSLSIPDDGVFTVYSVLVNGSTFNGYFVWYDYVMVRPTLYLSSNLKLSGTGTQSDPYTIE